MNALSTINGFEDMDADGAVSRNYEPMQRKQRRSEPRRKGHGGSSGGGMQCRRNKHFFGSGQSARLADLRAFAGAIALALVAMVSSASADTFTWKTVGSIGNAANPTTGLGAVSTNFKISAYETTNTQYAAFLNTSDAGKSNANSIWVSQMGSNSLGGITRSGAPGSYTYSVKSGYANEPVTFVNWFSAARFINWYANGATAASSTETGSYTLNGQTSGNIPARNAGAQVFLPSVDEWTKAAFYDATDRTYDLWPTSGNTQPVATVNPADKSTPNTAAYAATAADGMQVVGSYTNTVSTYGLWDMVGNVNELTDSSSISTQQIGTVGDPTKVVRMGGSLLTLSTDIGIYANSSYTGYTTANNFVLGTTASGSLGFRVAAVAVPEPGNMVAAAMGIGGLIAVHCIKRRKLALARVEAC